MKDFGLFSGPVLFVASLLSTGAAMVGWTYDNFQTRDAATQHGMTIEKRLERIENKLDKLFERVR